MGHYENKANIPSVLHRYSSDVITEQGFDKWLEALPGIVKTFDDACPDCLSSGYLSPLSKHEKDDKIYTCENGHWGSMSGRLSTDLIVRGVLQPVVEAMRSVRQELRQEGDFQRADRLREELYKLGYKVEDKQDSSKLRRR